MFIHSFSRPFLFLLGCLFLKSVIMIGLILYAGIGLGPDEAQYWTWSQQLDWGYYSKPPGIAWQIWLGTQLFGSTELGVRFFSLILSLIQSLGVYGLARQCGLNQRLACWCGIMMALTPLGIIGSFLAITDNGFLVFWIFSCLEVCASLKAQREPNPLLIGGLIAAGSLFKWPIYLFWVFCLLIWWKYPIRPNLIKVAAGLVVSLMGLVPSLIWNASHEWATFRHVTATVQGGHAAVKTGNVLEFIGAQLALVSPVLFVLLVLACWKWLKTFNSLNTPLVFCGGVTMLSLAGLTFAAFMQKIQGNWGIFAYPTAFILIGWYCSQSYDKTYKWLKYGVGLSVCMISLLFFTYSFIPYRLNPFKHNLGWNRLEQELAQSGYRPDDHFLVSDKYQTTSLLSFYGGHQKRAYFLNMLGTRKNQFSYWPSLYDERQNQTGFFIVVDNTSSLNEHSLLTFYQSKLENYFEFSEYVGRRPLFYQNGKPVKEMLIFKCQNCRLHNHLQDTYLY